MKVLIYYFAIGLPMLGLHLSTRYNSLDAKTFFILLMVYSLIYHPLISGIRLLQGNQITLRDLWRLFIPFFNIFYYSKHSKYLYLNK